MADFSLRELERRAFEGGTNDKARFMLERLRVGQISLFQLMVAAWLENEAAQAALAGEDVNVGRTISQGLWPGSNYANALNANLEDMAGRWTGRIGLVWREAWPSGSAENMIDVLFRMCFAALYEQQRIAWELETEKPSGPRSSLNRAQLRVSESLDTAVEAMYEMRRVYQSRFLVDMPPISMEWLTQSLSGRRDYRSVQENLQAQHDVWEYSHEILWEAHLQALLHLEEAFVVTMPLGPCSECGKGDSPCEFCQGTGRAPSQNYVRNSPGWEPPPIIACLAECLRNLTPGLHPKVHVARIIAAIKKDVLPWCVGETGEGDPMMGYTDLCEPHQL
jgi:hypothetical protein